jgi:hypothetical protein
LLPPTTPAPSDDATVLAGVGKGTSGGASSFLGSTAPSPVFAIELHHDEVVS